MSSIEMLDKNFEVGKTINKEGLKFYDTLGEPFVVYGLKHNGDRFYRMDLDVAKTVSGGVFSLSTHTAGGRIRFRTDSSCVAISAFYGSVGKMPHFAYSGSAGFDIYVDNVYTGTYMPTIGISNSLESIVNIQGSGVRDITINFPLYSEIKRVFVGVDEGAKLESPTPYVNTKPVVYYGSSITQGGCASRPGTCYQAYVSRKFNLDYINLGFSGNARAEDAMIEYIKGLDMSIFVYDYDHNAPSVDYLENTHNKMFRAIREAHPNLPIIMMSRPKHNRTADDERRLEIIKTNYVKAKALGDRNVYFLDGDELTALCGGEGTVDNCHPTDFGFASMANALIDLIKTAELDKKLV